MNYFWYWQPQDNFPPSPFTRPHEYQGGERLNVACTQTGLPAREERGVVDDWCDALPRMNGVRLLWFSSRLPQRLFDAACSIRGLDGMYVKWSAIENLSAIERASTLQYFHLGPSSRVSSIEPLGRCHKLLWLGLELLSQVREFKVLSKLSNLEGLSLEGTVATTWCVATLGPLSSLTKLRYLSIANLRAEDRSLSGLFPLHSLVTFRHASWWDVAQLAEIVRANPGLAAA